MFSTQGRSSNTHPKLLLKHVPLLWVLHLPSQNSPPVRYTERSEEGRAEWGWLAVTVDLAHIEGQKTRLRLVEIVPSGFANVDTAKPRPTIHASQRLSSAVHRYHINV